jgi:hypothetical protein
LSNNGRIGKTDLFVALRVSIEAFEETTKRLEAYGYVNYDRATDEYAVRVHRVVPSVCKGCARLFSEDEMERLRNGETMRCTACGWTSKAE